MGEETKITISRLYEVAEGGKRIESYLAVLRGYIGGRPALIRGYIQGVKASDLKAQFTVNFGNNKQMYQDFKAEWEENSHWKFNDNSNTATLNF